MILVGIASSGDKLKDLIPSNVDGYFGLGFKVYTFAYNTVSNLFDAVDTKFITIYRDKDLKVGSINVGSKGDDKCVNKKISGLYDIQQDSGKNLQWWFKADT